jgi:predicted acylesterase/phospholipase RssA
MNAAALAAAQVVPSVLAAAESGAIGAASIAAQLRAAEQGLQNQKIMATYSSFRAKEAADAAASNTFKSSTLSTASTLMGSGGTTGNTTVNLTVNGTVSTEQDLINAVRNGLLRTQYNGSQINLQAV